MTEISLHVTLSNQSHSLNSFFVNIKTSSSISIIFHNTRECKMKQLLGSLSFAYTIYLKKTLFRICRNVHMSNGRLSKTADPLPDYVQWDIKSRSRPSKATVLRMQWSVTISTSIWNKRLPREGIPYSDSLCFFFYMQCNAGADLDILF